ncbi:hypothetical protein [Desulfobotulus mexicanus]|nr:hypothetical protein [Desulfobotulus mexicanus]
MSTNMMFDDVLEGVVKCSVLGLRIRRPGVRIPPGAPRKSRVYSIEL